MALLYGREFVGAALPFQLLVVEGAITAVTSTLAQAFMTVGPPGVVTLLQLTSFAGAVLLVLLTPLYGIVGAASALLPPRRSPRRWPPSPASRWSSGPACPASGSTARMCVYLRAAGPA